MRALLAAALLAFALPPASAGPVTDGCHAEGVLCFWEHSVASGSCDDGDGVKGGSTTAEASGPDARATASGSSTCFASEGATTRMSTLSVGVESGSSHAAFEWGSREHKTAQGATSQSCHLLLDSSQGTIIEDCPAGMGPPPAGWGQLLP